MSVNHRGEIGLRRSVRYGLISQEQYHAAIADRNTAWRELTPAQQLVTLDTRLGLGRGAERQRAKLCVLLPVAHDIIVPVEMESETETPVASMAEGRRRDAFKKERKKKHG